jgi:hypothetical protein
MFIYFICKVIIGAFSVVRASELISIARGLVHRHHPVAVVGGGGLESM